MKTLHEVDGALVHGGGGQIHDDDTRQVRVTWFVVAILKN
jgi:hypothetical protein